MKKDFWDIVILEKKSLIQRVKIWSGTFYEAHLRYMKHFPYGKYEAMLRCMKRDPNGSHVFLPWIWAKKILIQEINLWSGTFYEAHLRYMKHFPYGKYEALLRCMKCDPNGSHVFLPWIWAKKIPASNYSPTLECAVPSSLGPLSIVFGMGTWVSSLL